MAAFASGYGVELPEGSRFRDVALRGNGTVRALGSGATLLGRGTAPIVRFTGDGSLYNVLLQGASIGDASEDGVRLEDGTNVWCDRVAVTNVYDEQMDLYDPGIKRITWTRSAFVSDDGYELGPLMGSNNTTRPAVDMWATFYRCHFEVNIRAPRVAAVGARAHLVNSVHARWVHSGVDASYGGVAILQGEVASGRNTGSGGLSRGAAYVQSGPGGIYHDNSMLLDGAVIRPSTDVARPKLPYPAIAYEVYSDPADAREFGRTISEAAGPRFVTKKFGI